MYVYIHILCTYRSEKLDTVMYDIFTVRSKAEEFSMSILYTVHCTLYSVQCTVQCGLYCISYLRTPSPTSAINVANII